MTDWLLAIGITSMFVVFIVALLFIAGFFKRRPGDELAEERLQRWELRCRKRLAEMEQKLANLETLIEIADEKIVHLEDLNTQAETARLTAMGRGAGRSGDLQKIVNETFNREFKERVRELQLEMETRFHTMQMRPGAMIDEEDDDPVEDYTNSGQSMLSGDSVETRPVPRRSLFNEYVPGVFNPDQDDENFMKERFHHIRHLADTGLSAEEISHVVRMEKSTVDMILGLSGQVGLGKGQLA